MKMMNCQKCNKKIKRNSGSQKYCKKCASKIWRLQRKNWQEKRAKEHLKKRENMRCVICGEKIGHIPWAKKCCNKLSCKHEIKMRFRKKYCKPYYQKHREKIIAYSKKYQKKYGQTPRGREVGRHASLKYIRKKRLAEKKGKKS